MASITKQANGRREVQFVGTDGKRRTLRLGRVDQKTAETFRVRIEEIMAARVTGDAISPFTAQWLRGLSDQFHDRFVRAGLCATRVREISTDMSLKAALEAFIIRRDDVKPVTLAVYSQAQNHLQRILGADRSIRSITAAEATDYRRALRRAYSEAYTAKMIIQARLIWRDAVDRGLADKNVFSKVPTGSQVNVANQRYIEQAAIEEIIAVCPDPQWKLLIALSRYAGLRCPSEHLALKWDDIDWKRGRMTVRATKTEHHPDKGIRVVPIFSELRPYLQTVFDQRDDDGDSVITRYRNANGNLRTQFIRYIKKAGLSTWPRLFHNLRASCQTDLAERFPAHVVCAWIGNSEAVARAHYLQTTDAHFEKAVGAVEALVPAVPKSDAESDAVGSGIESQGDARTQANIVKIKDLLRSAVWCDLLQVEKWAMGDSNPRPQVCDTCVLAS